MEPVSEMKSLLMQNDDIKVLPELPGETFMNNKEVKLTYNITYNVLNTVHPH